MHTLQSAAATAFPVCLSECSARRMTPFILILRYSACGFIFPLGLRHLPAVYRQGKGSRTVVCPAGCAADCFFPFDPCFPGCYRYFLGSPGCGCACHFSYGGSHGTGVEGIGPGEGREGAHIIKAFPDRSGAIPTAMNCALTHRWARRQQQT